MGLVLVLSLERDGVPLLVGFAVRVGGGLGFVKALGFVEVLEGC